MCTSDRQRRSRSKLLAASLPARGLWVSAEIWLSEYGTGDTVPGYVLAALGGTPELIAELVRAGAWEAAGDDIRFASDGPRRDVQATAEASQEPARHMPPSTGLTPGARRQALTRAGIRHELRARDADRCRYCARRVRWGKGRAADSAVWDWLEPDGPASTENVVTACKACAGAKAGRSLKDSGMVLLDPPGPETRNASRDASDLRKDERNASRNASEGVRNAYTLIDRSKSDQSLSSGVSQEPVQVTTGRARKPNAKKPGRGTQEFRLAIIAAFAAKTLIEITVQQADALAAEVLAHVKGRCPSPLNYVLTAIENEDNPVGRWLPERAARTPEAPPVPRKAVELEWCRECDPDDRSRIDADGKLYWCPACSPKSFAAYVASAPREAA